MSVTRCIDAKNEVSPSVSLKNGDVAYGYTRKWEGGALKSKLFPGEKVEVEWTDNGSQGTWTTTAEVPLDNRSVLFTFSFYPLPFFTLKLSFAFLHIVPKYVSSFSFFTLFLSYYYIIIDIFIYIT